MFIKLSVLIPTRMRLQRLATLLESFEATVPRKTSAELVFRVDEDDTWTQEFLTGHAMFVGPRCNGYGSMPQFFNEMVAVSSGGVLMCGNDDMIFRSYDWPTKLLEVANLYPDGIFDLGVTTHNAAHYPFSTVSRRMVEELGFIWDPRIFWGDIYLRDVAAYFNRCVMVPEVEIEHDWAGRNPDETYRQTLRPKRRIEGSETYWSGPHAEAVRDAVEKLKAVAVC